MDKKNTILLTVIAVATLLVAVVGASFAFFAVQDRNTADVTVETTTAEAADLFVANSEGELKLAVTNEAMQEADKNEGNYLSATATVNVELTAGSGNASCDYTLTYAAAEGTDTYTPTSGITGLEYSILGTVVDETGAAIADTEIEEVSMANLSTLGTFTITDAFDADAETQAASKHVWTLETRFYNLPTEQNIQLDKTFGGNITVTGVTCENN